MLSKYLKVGMHGHLTVKTHIFLTGATGYIGGSVLARLLCHPRSDTFQTTILVRSESKVSQFRSMGIKAVVGSYNDLDLLSQLAEKADIVIACANADDLNAAKAILKGLQYRYKRTGVPPSLIHTSGTGVLIDDAQGMYPSDVIYSDMDVAQLKAIPETQPHRVVDLDIVKADEQGFVKTYIILPGTIYGRASGSLVDAGLQNPISQQIPTLVEASLSRGQAGVLGKGKNIWPNVHIDEVADLFKLVVDSVISYDVDGNKPRILNSAFSHGWSGFYFAENGEHTLCAVSEAIGKAMVDLRKAKNATPTTFTDDETQRLFPPGTIAFLNSNARCRADRSKAIGWKPKKTTKDILVSIKEEVRSIQI